MLTLLLNLLLGITTLLTPTAWGAPPAAHAGLPGTLNADFVEHDRFIPFEQTVGTFRAPFGGSIFFNDVAVSPVDFTTLEKVFAERFLAIIAPGTRIYASEDDRQREIWDYPIGTRVLHEISFRESDPRLFEMRIVEKVSSRQWAFGVYETDPNAPDRLKLNTYSNTPEANYVSGTTRVRMRKIHLGSCQSCHFVNSPSEHQFETFTDAGPCGFGPHNPSVKTTWAENYKRTHGYEPIEARR